MASHPAPSRPSRRPRGGAPSESELNVYPTRDDKNGIVVDAKPPKKTLKRPRRLSEAEQHDHFGLKKSRFATIEVDTRPRAQPRKLAVAKPTKTPTAKPETATQRQTRNKEEDTTEETRVLPKYAEKASNGIKHELERLQPDGKDTKSETRKLRSQEGTRFKSELASYFPDYDVVIGNEAAEETRKFGMPLD